MIIAIDYDGTLTTGKDKGYSKNFWESRELDIEFLNELRRGKELGFKYILFSSRLSSEALQATIRQLEEHDALHLFESIFLDKPFYDYIIDDKLLTKEEFKNLVDKEFNKEGF